ncbi:MAG TPA: BREX-2 system adenine-specific DNA-methyltransferase PglX [Streptosporangiaceae bacterium]|nr:BREX-2 system adenine-specific DNA-methyltransferase PglX [Streptosporangiaceae bacterium]
MLLAVMKAGNVKRLTEAHDFPLNIAVGDSLLHGRGGAGEQGELFGASGVFTYRSEDVSDYITTVDILGVNSYHVVVGNPPYITVADSQENTNYRKAYKDVCSGQYALSVPFAARFFRLAHIAGGDRRGAGYVGQITANSFMKREFGKKLIEEFFGREITLTHVIDTSGAYIPGHGTPTVVLVGRNLIPTVSAIRATLGVRGEPTQPDPPEKGKVWQAIINQISQPGSDSEWITVTDLSRSRLSHYPWTLTGGGAGELKQVIETASPKHLSQVIDSAGFMAVTREDDAYFTGGQTAARLSVDDRYVVPVSGGAGLRDWRLTPETEAIFPYETRGAVAEASSQVLRHLWRYRRHLAERRALSGTQEERGLAWYEYSNFYPHRWASRFRIGFAFVATNNQFVLARQGCLLIRTAPVIMLPEGASEDDHLALLGMLNSSTACFWLQQVSHNKGEGGGARVDAGYSAMGSEAWKNCFEFTGTKLQDLPLPAELPLEFGRVLDGLAQRLSGVQPSATCATSVPTRDALDAARAEHDRIRGRMIALQEELDWEVYRLYGLLSEQEAAELCADPDEVPELRLGERAVEIVLARRMAAGDEETQWFARHGSTPITEIPLHWPQAYREVVQRRIEVIGRRRDLALIERPECKRRWQAEPWEKKEQAALRAWLLDRCERRDLWFAPSDTGTEEPRPMTVNRLADRLRGDADFMSVARLYAQPDADLAEVIAGITDAEHVPYLAALRYKDTGLRKREQWERTWDLQREEDATGERLNIPVPPKYASADFRKGSYWSNRGKLDVPKERFISYPLASPDGDGSLLLGWGGWDHREQAHALMTIIEDRASRDGWDCGRVMPLIAGLAEVMPWVRQWHGEVDAAFGMSPADAYAGYLEDQQRRCGVTGGDLAAWRPSPSGRGRPPRSGATTAANAATDS